ncbi:hypothetical protein DFH11DRAFT_1734026 [Phellopilus nigrolimitatus]|nr:hypothetical protein DFH11DRAFT_1734026 [Phellopilus nigrolimitatus]
MDAVPSKSPESPRRAVKVTYANRKRKARGGKDAERGDPDASSGAAGAADGTAETSAPPPSAQTAHERGEQPGLPPAQASAKKRAPRKSNAKDARAAPGGPAPGAPEDPDRNGTPPLAARGAQPALASRARPGAMPPPSASVSVSDTSDRPEGVRGAATRTTEAGRRAYFEAHTDVAALEPHRVRCGCCGMWLKLHATQRYALAPWKAHTRLCSPGHPGRRARLSTDSDARAAAEGEKEDDDDDDAASAAPSVSASEVSASPTAASLQGAPGRRSAEEREQLLAADALAGEVRADAVFCAACGKWIRLSGKTRFQLVNWARHAARVHGRRAGGDGGGSEAPSGRVREAERKLQLVNDAQAREFAANRVACAACGAEVRLSETAAYQLDRWLEHKAACTLVPLPGASAEVDAARAQPEVSPPVRASPLAADAPPNMRPPPSTASTDMTCVNADSSADSCVAPLAGPALAASVLPQKRAREEDEGEGEAGGEEGQGAAVRRRTEGYVRSEARAPGPWGWFWEPWETFKKGFSEGLWAGQAGSAATT